MAEDKPTETAMKKVLTDSAGSGGLVSVLAAIGLFVFEIKEPTYLILFIGAGTAVTSFVWKIAKNADKRFGWNILPLLALALLLNGCGTFGGSGALQADTPRKQFAVASFALDAALQAASSYVDARGSQMPTETLVNLDLAVQRADAARARAADELKKCPPEGTPLDPGQQATLYPDCANGIDAAAVAIDAMNEAIAEILKVVQPNEAAMSAVQIALLAQLAMLFLEQFAQMMSGLVARLQKANAEGRDLTDDEIEEINQEGHARAQALSDKIQAELDRRSGA